MATFLGFFVALLFLVFAAPVQAQRRSDPGEPIRLARPATDGSIRYRAGENTGYYRMLARVNQDRPEGAQLDERAFDAANQCRVIYVCDRPGRPLRVDRNGSCPELNGTSHTIDYDTFCQNGERVRWLVDGQVYYSRDVPPPPPTIVPEEPETAEAVPVEPPTVTVHETVVPAPSPAPRAASAPREIHPPVAPPAPGRPRATVTTTERDHGSSALFILALLAVGVLIGSLITFLLMRNARDEHRVHAVEYEALRKEWTNRFPNVPFNTGGLASLMPRAALDELLKHSTKTAQERFDRDIKQKQDKYSEDVRKLVEAQTTRERADAQVITVLKKENDDLKQELSARRALDQTLSGAFSTILPDIARTIQEIKDVDLDDEPTNGSSRRSPKELNALAREKLRLTIALQAALAVALGNFRDALDNLKVAASLGFAATRDSAFRQPWFEVLCLQIRLAYEGKVLRQRGVIAALNAPKTTPPPPPEVSRPSITKTIGPPRLAGGPTVPTPPKDIGMGPDPFPIPSPTKG